MALDDKFYSQENINVAGVRFAADAYGALQNVCPQPGNNPQLYPANGAISVASQTALLTKAGVDAMTLAAPVATTQDFMVITVTSTTANAHTVTATALFKTGTASVNLATFAAFAGAGFTVMAYQGLWYVISSVGVTFS